MSVCLSVCLSDSQNGCLNGPITDAWLLLWLHDDGNDDVREPEADEEAGGLFGRCRRAPELVTIGLAAVDEGEEADECADAEGRDARTKGARGPVLVIRLMRKVVG